MKSLACLFLVLFTLACHGREEPDIYIGTWRETKVPKSDTGPLDSGIIKLFIYENHVAVIELWFNGAVQYTETGTWVSNVSRLKSKVTVPFVSQELFTGTRDRNTGRVLQGKWKIPRVPGREQHKGVWTGTIQGVTAYNW